MYIPYILKALLDKKVYLMLKDKGRGRRKNQIIILLNRLHNSIKLKDI